MSKERAVVAIIEKSGKFLFGKRSLHKKKAPGFWCPVSGKMEFGESEVQALVREVLEETNIQVKPLQKICSIETRDQSTVLHWWTVKIISDNEFRMNHEHSEMKWVTLEEMRQLKPVFEEDMAIFLKLFSPEATSNQIG